MKVLFLSGSAVLDFFQDMVFHGLVQLLGAASVRDYPLSYAYHHPPPGPTPFEPLYFDLPRRAAGELDELIDDCDAVVIGSLREDVLPSVRHLLSRSPRPPIAFLDGEDDPYVRAVEEYVDVYFKREVLDLRWPSLARARARRSLAVLMSSKRRRPEPLARWRTVAVRNGPVAIPLPLGVIPVELPPSGQRTTDVTFLANTNTSERVRLTQHIEALRERGLAVTTSSGLPMPIPWREYIQLMAQSRICLSLRGHGRGTVRYWEIPYAGSLLLSEPTGIVIPHDFTDNVDAAFAPRRNLVDRALDLLDEPERVAEIAARGKEHVMAHHLSTHRAEVVLDRLESVSRRRPRVLD